MQINLVHLYPNLMNIYGDQGNIDTFIYRSKKRGIKINLIKISTKDVLKSGSFDLLFAGGGQDKQQLIVEKDLQTKKNVLLKASQNNIPMLTICGTYQLFGKYFKPFKRPKLKGIGIFDAYTTASNTRKIGNLNIKLTNPISSKSNQLIGFENHSGNTYLGKHLQPLGKVINGFGNNGKDKTEGAVFGNTIGCYLHGSLLPKNPHLADFLIEKALANKYSKVKLAPLDDTLEWQAHQQMITRTNKKLTFC